MGLENYKIQSICENLCNKLCNHLTVIKGYFELSVEKAPINYSNELRKEIDDAMKSIKESFDELNS